jgi:hypothetical protein
MGAIADRRRVVASLLVSLVLLYLSRALHWLVERAGLSASSSAPTARPVQSLGEAAVYQLVLTPAMFVFGVLATVYLVARSAPEARGPIDVRFRQALRPYAVAGVPGACASLIFNLIPTSNADPTGPGQFALGCFDFAALVAAASYSITLTVNALSAGSGRSRWAVFLLWLLASALTLLVIEVVPALLALPFGVHLLPFAWLLPR